MIGTAQQFTEDNKWVSLMIDSGAATPVCPPWFATQFPLQHLEHGTGPQLRTVTNQRIKLHEVKQPILSVTRLVEQGFQLTLGDNPRLKRTTKGFNSTLENRDGPSFLQAEITTLPRGTKLQIHSTQQGQIGMIALHHKVLQTQVMQETTGSSTHKVNLSEYTGNTRRHFSYYQEHGVQSQQNNLRATEESNPRMAQRTRLRTSTK